MDRDYQPAFPVDIKSEYFVAFGPGLSKREYFAALIMQGLCANPNPGSMEGSARYAVQGADMLLAELEK